MRAGMKTLLSIVATVLLLVATAARPVAADDYQAKLIDLDRRYTFWSFEQNPTYATDSGVHDYDARLADYSPGAQAEAMRQLRAFRDDLAALQPAADAPAHDRVDYLLIRADLEADWWNRSVLRSLERNPTVYEGECANGIFAIVKRRYAADDVRIRDAIGRLRACPSVLAQGRQNLTDTVAEFAQIASEDVRDGDSLYTTTLDELARNVNPQLRGELHAAVDTALTSLHEYRAWLDSSMPNFHRGGFAVGKQWYEWYLRRALLLPFGSDGVAAVGRMELARDRALEAWEENRDLHEPPGPSQPSFATKAQFLAYYESSLARLKSFIAQRAIVDVPSYVGPFHIVEVPKAIAATYPGGFMNPPAMLSTDPQGFYFVPDFSPSNTSFFVAQARQSVLPILGHEGIPGHFLQFSYAYHNSDFIRHVHDDGVFAEGWAFYGEELLMRQGLYDREPAARRQVIHLMRHRATRIGVDVALATGTMTLPEAIAYFQKNAGIDAETARGEATRFAMNPGQAIDYLVGKTQIEALIGLTRDAEGAKFSLRSFHDRLLSYGTVPFSTIRYEWLADDAWLAPVADPLAPEPFR
jgi:uncharacterized protein (DUF885 family)